MTNIINNIVFAEVKHYLKGIRQEDIDKIPKKILKYINENASKDYKCNFDYNAPLKDLNILDETRGFIGLICYYYWCNTKELKKSFLKRINENEKRFQEKLKEKYNYDIFLKNNTNKTEKDKKSLAVEHNNLFKRLIKRIKLIIMKK